MPAPSLTARSPIVGASSPPVHLHPSCGADAPPPGASGAPAGAPSKRTDQRCHHHGKVRYSCVSGAASPETPPGDPGVGPRVRGWGAQAHAALVDALRDAGETRVAEEVADCGLVPLPVAAHVTVHSRGGGRRHMGGLTHCGRFQLCPQCTPFLMAKRLESLEGVGAKLAQDEGLRHFVLVLSLRHHRGARWKVLVAALRKMQATLRRSHRWRRVVVGFVRLLESTFGAHGHHPHEHLLVTIRVADGFDPEKFFRWVRETCEATARKASRTCNFQDGWWSEVSRDQLGKALGYFGSSDKMGTSSILSEFSTSTKHQPLWCIPPKAYAQVWRDSHRLRWFGVGGCWHASDTAKSDEELEQERQETGLTIAHVLREIWKAWTPQERRDRRAVVHDRTLTDDQVVHYVVACGGIAGPPPLPDWGEQVS